MTNGSVLVKGSASGALLVSDTGLSFWGGIDPSTGEVIDQHHPLFGSNISACILAIPNGRGSCSGSGALLELILNDCAPAGLIFSEAEDILTLGVLVAEALFERSLPILRLPRSEFKTLNSGTYARISENQLFVSQSKIEQATIDLHKHDLHKHDLHKHDPHKCDPHKHDLHKHDLHSDHHLKNDQSKVEQPTATLPLSGTTESAVALSAVDKDILSGKNGEAASLAMKILLQIANIQGAKKLIDVTQAHIDACIYHGPSSLRFAEELYNLGARFSIPTTLNAISVDERNWRHHGISETLGQPSSDLGNTYMNMGAQLSYTCAPYLLDTAPSFGEQIVWAESNAVMFANSVIGARTQKYPDFLDVFIALTGRAPASGSHLDDGRLPTVSVNIEDLDNPDEALWPLLGYYIGLHAGNDIPMITGLTDTTPDHDDLKAFSAAYATTGSSSMFHMEGITPEAKSAMKYCEKNGLLENPIAVTRNNLLTSFAELNSAQEPNVEVVCLGNPHFSSSECAKLAALVDGRRKDPNVKIMVTLGRAVYEKSRLQGSIATLEEFGVQFVMDTCWCMIVDPLIPPDAKTLMTNSGKYAHYGPALVQRGIHFGTLAACAEAACTGTHIASAPLWLTG